MSLLRATLTVSGLTMISRVLGFVRDMVTATILGAGAVADALFVAIKLPWMFRSLTAEGALTVAFVPMYSKQSEEDPLSADLFASRVMMALVLFLSPLVILGMVFMPALISLVAPGFEPGDGRFSMAVEMGRIGLPYIVIVSILALQGGALNARDRFAPFAAVPIILNLAIIASLIFLSDILASGGHAYVVGVQIAGVLQLIWMVVSCLRANVNIRLVWPKFSANIIRLLKLMAPGAIGAGLMHINALVDLILASLLPIGAVSFLYFGNRLFLLPIGVIGVALSTALLPKLSKQLGQAPDAYGQGSANWTLNRAMEFGLMLALPAMVALFVLADPIINILFERGEFTNDDSTASAKALAAYVIGLPAYILIKVLSSAFFAREDTVTPVKTSAAGVATNIIAGITLIIPFGFVGIALATALSGWVQAGLLSWLLLTRVDGVCLDDRLRKRLPRIGLSCLILGVYCVGMAAWIDGQMADVFWLDIGLLLGVVAGGVTIYGAIMLVIGGAKLSDISGVLGR